LLVSIPTFFYVREAAQRPEAYETELQGLPQVAAVMHTVQRTWPANKSSARKHWTIRRRPPCDWHYMIRDNPLAMKIRGISDHFRQFMRSQGAIIPALIL
jgi:hypothetical protein